jgi:ABC-type branched-subunit amino acid transport system permease subunit
VLEYLTKAPWGRVLRGIREDEEATLALGKNVFSFRLQAFVLGCAVLGLAGAVWSAHQGFISPDQFDPVATFGIYVMVILGGSGNNRGVIVGAFLFYGFDWVSTRLKDYLPQAIQGSIPPIRLMVIGVLLIILVLFRPEGIFKEKKRTYPPLG